MESESHETVPPLRVVPGESGVHCPGCGVRVRADQGGVCGACGRRFDFDERYFEEHGPEAFLSPPAPPPPSLSGLSLVAEAGLVLFLAFALFLLVRYVFGGWTWDAMLAAVLYWGAYALLRGRTLRRGWLRLLPTDRE